MSQQPRLVPIKLDNYKPLREIVFETLRDAIITGKMSPGERLMEIQLAEEMGVSRTPVREAIRKLELEGFVVMVPRKGAYVAGVSIKDIADVFEVRAALEGLAASLAAERITEDELDRLERSIVSINEVSDGKNINKVVESDIDFHDMLYQASRNQKLITIITNLKEQLQRYRATSLAEEGRTKDAVDEHKQIVEAISERNGELAAELARQHIENAENVMLNTLRKSKEFENE